MNALPDWLLKATRLAPRFCFGGAVLGLLILAMPLSVAKLFGIDTLRETHRPVIGLTTLVLATLWSLNIVPWFGRRLHRRRARRATIKRLWSLSPEEHLLLGYFAWLNSPTAYLTINDPAARSLCDKGLLVGASGSGNMFRWPYTIPDYIWERIGSSKKVLFPDLDGPGTSEMYQQIHQRSQRYAIAEPGSDW